MNLSIFNICLARALAGSMPSKSASRGAACNRGMLRELISAFRLGAGRPILLSCADKGSVASIKTARTLPRFRKKCCCVTKNVYLECVQKVPLFRLKSTRKVNLPPAFQKIFRIGRSRLFAGPLICRLVSSVFIRGENFWHFCPFFGGFWQSEQVRLPPVLDAKMIVGQAGGNSSPR